MREEEDSESKLCSGERERGGIGGETDERRTGGAYKRNMKRT